MNRVTGGSTTETAMAERQAAGFGPTVSLARDANSRSPADFDEAPDERDHRPATARG